MSDVEIEKNSLLYDTAMKLCVVLVVFVFDYVFDYNKDK